MTNRREISISLMMKTRDYLGENGRGFPQVKGKFSRGYIIWWGGESLAPGNGGMNTRFLWDLKIKIKMRMLILL